MFGLRVNKGVNVTRESWQVLRTEMQLLVFPLLSGIAGAAVIATVICAGILIPGLGEWAARLLNKNQPAAPDQQALGLACLFVIYYIEYAIVVFFNTALVGAAMMRFSGYQPTVSNGLRIAMTRLPQILAWAFVAAAVGTLLSAIERRLNLLGKIIIRLIGLSWAVATYFVVPVLAAEGSGPITSIRRSTSLLRKSWGEGLTGNFVISLGSMLVTLPIIALAVGGFALASVLQSNVLFIVTVAFTVVASLLMTVVTSALRQIFLAGLYCYATTNQVPSGFSEDSMQQALRRE